MPCALTHPRLQPLLDIFAPVPHCATGDLDEPWPGSLVAHLRQSPRCHREVLGDFLCLHQHNTPPLNANTFNLISDGDGTHNLCRSQDERWTDPSDRAYAQGMAEKKGMAKIEDLGPTGATTAANVKHFREQAHMTYADLARRTEELGHPIPSLGVRRIEALARRVSVDDLMVLAAALDVSPMALLLPAEESSSAVVTGHPQGQPLEVIRAWLFDLDPQELALDWIRKVRDHAESARTAQHEAMAGMTDGVTAERSAALRQASLDLEHAKHARQALLLELLDGEELREFR